MSLSKMDDFVKEVKQTKKMNVENWKEFKMGGKNGLFECGTAKQILKVESGDFPYITRSGFNNGLTKFVKRVENKINEGNCITIGAEGFYAFYQENQFMAGNKIYVLRHKKLNKNNGLFICSILNSVVEKYSYNNARILEKIRDEVHKLPVNKEGEPGWEYMEDYIRNLSVSSQNLDLRKLEELPKKIRNETKINLSSWKKFKLGDLFKHKRGKRYKKGDHKLGDIAYISSSAKNNGIDNFVNPPSTLTIYENCITIANSGSVGTCFYHDYKFVASDHVHVLWLKENNLKKEIALFLCAVIEQNKNKFMFNKEISESTIKEIEFFLPTKNDGPDWTFMEKHIKNISQQIYGSLRGS
jgi:nitrogen regulatory protein PII-like uncharacterized protein